MTRTSREVIQVFCASPAMCVHCPCQHVNCCSFPVGGLSNELLLHVIRLIGICSCCYPPLIIHAQICKETGLSVSSSNAGGVGEPAPGGGKMTPWVPVCFRAFRPPLPGRLAKKQKRCHCHCVLTIGQQSCLGFLSGIIRQNWNDTEKISMAPAQ